MENIKSPCNNTCKYVNGLCVGCYRTREEITHWIHLTNEEKQELLDNIKLRKRSFREHTNFNK